MGRPKKVVTVTSPASDLIVSTSPDSAPVVKTLLTPLTIDYTSEGLNDMARKINQIIEHLNAV